MGDDLAVVNAARVSLAKESAHNVKYTPPTYANDYDGGKVEYSLKAADKKLIAYLAKHKHWTPFAQVIFKFRIKMPIFIAREWYRHEVGLVRNEVSRRYVDFEPEFFIPKVWRHRPDKGIKQGSGEDFSDEENVEHFEDIYEGVAEATGRYNWMIKHDVAPEMARIILPQNMYTEFIETGSLAAYARIASLRIAPDAMKETRAYAEAVSELIRPIVPESWKALMGETSE